MVEGFDAVEETVKVCCRFRPQNEFELTHCGNICVEIPKGGYTVSMPRLDHPGPDKNHHFTFDKVFRWDCNQKEVYEFAAKPVINAVLQGFNGTVFAYGQTSSGKTFTMEGSDIEDKVLQGVIPRMVWSLFDGICHSDEHIEFLVKVSIVEIYNERIRDLLDPRRDNLRIHEDRARGVFIGEVTESYVQCEQEIFDAMRAGHYNRAMAVTNMNEHSSRSHLIFMLTLEQKNTIDRTLKVGKLHLVDLAGCEKVSKTGASGDRLDEAKNINKSLSALGNVINALTDKKYTHVPYRDSKLTRVLQESLGGNSKTTLIITCSPSTLNEQETLSTLRFGGRAKMIKNNARVNQERSVEELKTLLEKSDRQLVDFRLRNQKFEWLMQQNGMAIPPFEGVADLEEVVAGTAEPLMNIFDDRFSSIKEAQERIEEVRAENAELMERYQNIEQEQARLLKTIDEISAEREAYEAARNESTNCVQALMQEMKQLKEEVDQLHLAKKQLVKTRSSEHVTMLETRLLDEKDRVSHLQERLRFEKQADQPLKRKVSQLDKNLEQLTMMYHKLVSQNNGHKLEAQVHEKKIYRKEQRIGELERNLRDAKHKYEKLLTQCANLTCAMEGMGAKSKSDTPEADQIEDGLDKRAKSKIVKPVKGGITLLEAPTEMDSDSPRKGCQRMKSGSTPLEVPVYYVNRDAPQNICVK